MLARFLHPCVIFINHPLIHKSLLTHSGPAAVARERLHCHRLAPADTGHGIKGEIKIITNKIQKSKKKTKSERETPVLMCQHAAAGCKRKGPKCFSMTEVIYLK